MEAVLEVLINKPDTIIALVAMVVALTTAIFIAYQAFLSRKHNMYAV